MDAALFTKMLSDKNVLDLRGLGYQFPQADIKEFTELLKNGFYHSLPLKHPALRGQGDGGGDCFHLHH